MERKIVQLEDGTYIEVEVSPDEAQQISGGFTKTINSTFEKIQPLLVKVCRPIIDSWKELNKEMSIEKAEVELGLSFSCEGNIFITKSNAGANLSIRLTLKPTDSKV